MTGIDTRMHPSDSFLVVLPSHGHSNLDLILALLRCPQNTDNRSIPRLGHWPKESYSHVRANSQHFDKQGKAHWIEKLPDQVEAK